MAVTPACVAAVVDASGGRMNDAEATDLIRYMETLRKAEEARGNLDGLADRVMALARQDAERAQIAAAIARKHAALSAVAYARALEHLRGLVAEGLTYRKAVLALLEGTVRDAERGRASVAATSLAYFDRYMQAWNLAIARDPELAKRMRDPDFGRAVVIEMRELRDGGKPGRSGDPKALELAQIYTQASELARVDLNRHGATIGKLDGWSPQGHDGQRVIRVAQHEWIDFILPRLDRERTFGTMDDELVRQALRDIYDEITLGTSRNTLIPENPGKVRPANLANTLGQSRTLHFRDAEAWHGYAERFGSDIHAAMLGHLNKAAKAAAQMQVLGPNPGATLQRLRLALVEMARTDKKLTQVQRAEQISSLRGGTLMNRAIDSSWAEVSGMNAAPGNIRMAQIGTTLRAWQMLARLGGAVVTSITDIPQRSLAMTMQGQPMLQAWRQNFADTFSPGKMKSRKFREMAAVMHAGVEGSRGQIIAAGIAEDAPMGKVHKLTAAFFRIQGLTAWQDWRKAQASWGLARWMGFNADRPLDGINARYRAILRQHGIGAEDWELIRSVAREVEGDRYVTPDRIADIPLAKFAGLAKPALEALDKGLAERTAKRAAADAREAQWVKGRTDKLAETVQRGIAGLQRINQQAEGGRDRRVAELVERLGELQARLSDLAEFQDAIAEGRVWDPPAAPAESAPAAAGFDPDIAAWRAGAELPADVAAAEARAAELAKTPTSEIRTPERLDLQRQAARAVLAERVAQIGGAVAAERRAVIVMGPPAAGKSTVADPIAVRLKAVVVDSDDMKARLPKFEGGVGAGRVHEESAVMAETMRQDLSGAGVNMVLPIVGSGQERVATLIAELKASGYRVDLVLNDLPLEDAARRNMARFRRTGRLVPMSYLMSIGDSPRANYMSLRAKADGHAEYSNAVPRGAPPLYRGGTSDLLGADATSPGGGPGGDQGARPGRSDARADDPGAAPRPGAEGEGGRVGPRSSNTARSGEAATGGAGRVFSPRSERYLDTGNPAMRAARAEGELRSRTDALRRTIGSINRAAGQAEKTRLSAFLSWWNERQVELDDFARRMDERAAARAEWQKADDAAWQPRADAALADARRDLEVKLRRFFADEMRFAYIETDATSRRLALQGTQGGTVVGEIMRTLAQFKGWPIAFTQRTLGRAIYGQPNRTAMDRLLTGANVGSVVATMMFAGYLTLTLKDLLRGYGPRDPTERQTLLAALVQGGGAGIFGDFLFGQANRFGGSFAATVAGPLVGGVGEDLQKLYLMAREGDVKSGRALGILLQNTPFLNLWYLRPVLDFLVLNALREHLSPGHLSKLDRDRRRDFGQERVLPRSAFDF